MKTNDKKAVVEYEYESETAGTYRYTALGSNGQSLKESHERLPVGANTIYVLKSYGAKPERIRATFEML